VQKPSSTLLALEHQSCHTRGLAAQRRTNHKNIHLHHVNRAKMLGQEQKKLKRPEKNKNKCHGTGSVVIMIGGVDVQIKFQP
jgi:hypothetical protein